MKFHFVTATFISECKKGFRSNVMETPIQITNTKGAVQNIDLFQHLCNVLQQLLLLPCGAPQLLSPQSILFFIT